MTAICTSGNVSMLEFAGNISDSHILYNNITETVHRLRTRAKVILENDINRRS